MIRFIQGNLLEADADALVNTVNTVGVMGKGIALMFKEKFPENTREYELACREGRVRVGHMLVTRRHDLVGPKWIINFPTKQHWRNKSKLEWIDSGLQDLVRVISASGIRSIALPPLGSGNGGLSWSDVRPRIVAALSNIPDLDVLIFEPTPKYQNVMKRDGVQKLTPARALVAELVRRYWVLGFECSLLEIQKLAYFLEDAVTRLSLSNPLGLEFTASRYGPYAFRLAHLLNGLDGSYLHCDKRLSDAGPFDVIWFDDTKTDSVAAYLTTAEARPYRPALKETTSLIDGFESPLGLELLATVHWMTTRMGIDATSSAVIDGLAQWPGGDGSGVRKQRLFNQRLVDLALRRLAIHPGSVNA